jgi:hypothetical protein
LASAVPQEYLLVGQLLKDKPLQAFSGEAGAQLIVQLKAQWYHCRQSRSKAPRAPDAPALKPLGHNTVRLRLSALLKVLEFAKTQLPPGTEFALPNMKEDTFEWRLPPAHARPRKEQPSDEEFAQALRTAGPTSDLGEAIATL